MIILSLFDGVSAGQLALNIANIKYSKYYASENDKYAIAVTQYNFPNTIQLGDVEDWQTWAIDWAKIDVLIGGSPCQGFSFAGKQLNFEDPRSKLFFIYVSILNHIKKHNPDVKFFLENVNMKKEYQHVISRLLGVRNIRLNSNLLSAQNRDRLYWSNINTIEVGLFKDIYTYIPTPKDKGILLKDILESKVEEKYFVKKDNLKGLDINKKSPTQRSSTGRCLGDKHNYQIIKLDKYLNEKTNQDKASCLTAGGNSGGNHSDMDIICVAMRGRENGQQLEPNTENKTNCITSVAKDNLIIQLNPSTESGGKQPYQQNRVYSDKGISPCLNTDKRTPIVIQSAHGFNKGGIFEDKSPTLLSNSWEHNNHVYNNYRLRRLTPIEVERLQTFPDNYTLMGNFNGQRKQISDTQRYKQMGNSWTVDIIVEFFKYLT